MKLSLCLPVACFLACSGITHAQKDDKKPYDGEEDLNAPDQVVKDMLGTYVGEFGKHKITLCISQVIGDTLTGYSIVAGNERAFSGSWSAIGLDFAVVAKEPGNERTDGVFRFTWMRNTTSLIGEWEPNEKAIGLRKFTLPLRKFKYDPKVGKYPQASTRKLVAKDVENLKNEELRLMRNEIYARHGYSFKLADMREHFDKLDWYMPVAVDIQTQLTKTEKANAELIRRYEKYSADHYDDFGR